jgi:hypothetical protein
MSRGIANHDAALSTPCLFCNDVFRLRELEPLIAVLHLAVAVRAKLETLRGQGR